MSLVLSSAHVLENVELLTHILRPDNIYTKFEDWIELMMTAKATCKFWRGVCRSALTDPQWLEADEYCSIYNMMASITGMRLPQRCTIHPDYSGYCHGFTTGANASYEPGNPSCSICGVLLDIKVKPSPNSDPIIFEVEHIELQIDGMEGTFDNIDSIWDVVSSKFGVVDKTKFVNYLCIGLYLRGNSYWTTIESTWELLNESERFYCCNPTWHDLNSNFVSPQVSARNYYVCRTEEMISPKLLRADGSACFTYTPMYLP